MKQYKRGLAITKLVQLVAIIIMLMRVNIISSIGNFFFLVETLEQEI